MKKLKIEKSDIDDKRTDLETKDEQFDWDEKTDQNCLYKNPENPALSVLKLDNLRKKIFRVFGMWVQKKHNNRKKNNREN